MTLTATEAMAVIHQVSRIRETFVCFGFLTLLCIYSSIHCVGEVRICFFFVFCRDDDDRLINVVGEYAANINHRLGLLGMFVVRRFYAGTHTHTKHE